MYSVDAKISAHEAVCAERWAAIKIRMSRIESIIIASSGVMIVGLFGVVGFLVSLYIQHVR